MTTLAQYDRARVAIAEATRIDEVLPLLDEFELAKLRAKQINDQALLADATEFQMRAERRLGQVIEAAKAAGLFRQGRQPKVGKSNDPELSSRPTLEEAGIGKRLSSRAQKRSGIAEQAFELMVSATREKLAAANANPINGARSVQGSRVEDAASLDFSPTPPWATRALIERVLPAMHISRASLTTAHEPACGEGHMAEVLREYFRLVGATDIHDYGYSDSPVCDFLDPETEIFADWIITNPPFKEKAEAFALKAIAQAKVGAAIFARLQWLETIGRYERLFREHPPTQLAFFAERVNLCMGRWEPDGGTATAYIWLVWVKGRSPRPPFWIPPGCQETLTKPDDSTRFTTHPVMKQDHVVCDEPFDNSTGEILAAPLEDIPVFLRREPVPRVASQSDSAGSGG